MGPADSWADRSVRLGRTLSPGWLGTPTLPLALSNFPSALLDASYTAGGSSGPVAGWLTFWPPGEGWLGGRGGLARAASSVASGYRARPSCFEHCHGVSKGDAR